jgi:3-polyprenyl-4-hydroxybenzoate decarboxylase
LDFRGFLEQLEREGKVTRIRKVSTELDPFGDLTDGKKARTCKMGLDATIPLKGTGKGFKREKYRKVDLNKFL